MNTLLAAAAGEVLFILLSPIWIIIAGYAVGFAAHSLLVVVEQTAVGFDRVSWPEERIIDWWWKPLYAFGLLGIWVGLLGGVLVPLLELDRTQEVTLTLALIWLIWPLTLLSSLSGPSRLLLLRWEVVKRLAERPFALLTFYLTTAALLFAFLLVLWFAVIGYEAAVQSLILAGLANLLEIGSFIIGLPLAGAIGATVVLLYARLLGRLAWITRLGGMLKEVPELTEPDEVEEAVEVREQLPAAPPEPIPVGSADALAVTAPPAETYALAPAEPLPVVTEARPFRWEPGRLPPARPPRSEWRDRHDVVEGGDERDDKPQILHPGDRPPLLCGQVFHFPWYRNSLKPWLLLSVGLACVALLLRLHASFR